MNIGPILQRELRRQSRQWSTYWLRVLGGALVLAACAWGFAVTNTLLQQLPAFASLGNPTGGRGLFIGLNRLMACLVWLIGPLLPADCLDRGKRDGTLGLLFLTPLRAGDVVLGKALSHALRALMVLLAAYPVLMLPVLMGGVGWADGVRMFLLQLAVLGLALAAGVTASALSREWMRAQILALLLTLGASVAFAAIHVGVSTSWQAYTGGLGTRGAGAQGGIAGIWDGAVILWGSFCGSLNLWARQNVFHLLNPIGLWSSGGLPGTSTNVGMALLALILCWGLVGIAVRFAAAGLTRTWLREASPPPPNPMNRAAAALTEERFGLKFLKGGRRRLLDRSPIAWLHGARWTSRVGRLLWAGLASVIVCIAFTSGINSDWVATSLPFVLVPLVLAVAFSAAASFRGERETGALELILVTPVTPQQMLTGRLRGLWGTFGLALCFLTVALFLGLAHSLDPTTDPAAPPWMSSRTRPTLCFELAGIWTAPLGVAVLGLGFGLRWTGFLGAWYRALAAWFLIPYAAPFGLLSLAALSDFCLGTAYSPWEAFSDNNWPPQEKSSYPTLIGFMVSTWWWPFMLLVTAVRACFLWWAWRLGTRALAERLFVPKPRNMG